MYLNFQTSVLTDSLAAEFKNDLQTPLKIVFYARYICIGMGGFLLLACICYLTWKLFLKQVCTNVTKDFFLLICCVLTPLSAIFQLYHGDQV